MEMLPRKRYVGAINVLFIYYCVLKVYKCLQPLMICMSSSVTTSIIDKISEGFDAEVKYWRDNLKSHLQDVRMFLYVIICYSCILNIR